MSLEILLKIEKVSKRFAGIQALSDVSFSLCAGEVMALAGHNGAGKSVLCKIMGGFYKPDSGSIYFNGQKTSLNSPHDAQKMGCLLYTSMVMEMINAIDGGEESK